MQADDYPYLQHDGFIAVAHRGGTSEWPENSMRAFESAIALGYRYIETDVHATRDGVLVAIHDHVLDRVTESSGVIADLDYADVSRARLGGSEPVPTMQEALDAWPDIKFNIDPKSDAAVEPLCDLIERSGAIDRVCVGSFSGARLRRVRERLGPRLCTSMGPREVLSLRLASLGIRTEPIAAACAQVATRHYGVPTADRAMIRTAHDRGMQLHVWTINTPSAMHRLIDRGVDAIMTDDPAALKTVLLERGLW